MPERAVDRSPDNPFTPKNAVVGDFFAPFFTVRFLTAVPQQGENVDGTTGAETTEDIEEMNSIAAQLGDTKIRFTTDGRTASFRSYATSLTITNQGGGACMVELRLEPPLEDALVLIEQRLVQFNSVMVVEWGWLTNGGQDSLISDKHYFVTQVPKLDIAGTDVTITIVGMDLFGYSAMKRETRKVYKRSEASADGVVYDTDYKILEALVKKPTMRLNTTLAPQSLVKVVGYGLFGVPLVSVTPLNLPIHTKRPTSPEEADFVEQNEKDWVFFKRICEMNRCDYFTIGDTIFLVDQNIARTQKYAYRLVFWNQLQRSDDIPIYSFTTSALPQLFLPPESKEVVCDSANEDNRSNDRESVDPLKMPDFETMGRRGAGGKAEADGRTLRITDDVQLVPNPAFASDETGKRISCPGGAPNKSEHVKRLVRDANSICNTNMEVSIPGVPGLCPMQVVRVEGVSKIFSGAYIVLKVVHKLTTDGYDCDVTLIREATTGDDEAGRGTTPVTGGNNPDQAPEGQGVDEVEGEKA